MAVTALSNPLRHTPLQLLAGWLPAGMVSTESIKDTVKRAARAAGSSTRPSGPSPATTGPASAPFGRVDAPTAEIADAVAASCAIPGFFRPADPRAALCGRRRLLRFERRPARGPRARPDHLSDPARRATAWAACTRSTGSATGRRPPTRSRDQEGPALRHGRRHDPAVGRGPGSDGAQPDERRAAPPGDRDRRPQRGRAATDARGPSKLEGLPPGEPHKIKRPSGPPEWPRIRPTRRAA